MQKDGGIFLFALDYPENEMCQTSWYLNGKYYTHTFYLSGIINLMFFCVYGTQWES
jgi:hypothetical protein